MSLIRGWLGEKKTAFHMWLSLDRHIYRRFHDVIIPGINGTTQIDHILVSPYGIFIVETKNLKGWIFGSENQAKWTQSIYGGSYLFQNPLRQTFRQQKVLSEFLDLPETTIHVVIFFVGNCEFKIVVPNNVITSGLSKYIRRYRSRILSEDEIDRVSRRVKGYVSIARLKNRDHVVSLRRRLSSTTNCPKCGGRLVERTAKKGPNAGNKFLGCQNYPECKFTRALA
ncbi:MAG TPA: NERD domain-containing protein [Alphaproteobacteria bacterium]|nr:NERD domain-containing protein [Alphaproteobacteria bacterium]